MKRKNSFHAEQRLPASDRAELEDYTRSGFDRGHMSPSGDMPDEQAQYESFSLANIVPQYPKNNQILWGRIEENTRNMVRRRGELYVITGPIFEGGSLQRLNGRVLVPTHIFKALYDPVQRQGAAYVALNADIWNYQIVSIGELERRIGMNLFPKLEADRKESAMELPPPQPYPRRPQKSDSLQSEPAHSAR
jgi:endonuclease G